MRGFVMVLRGNSWTYRGSHRFSYNNAISLVGARKTISVKNLTMIDILIKSRVVIN